MVILNIILDSLALTIGLIGLLIILWGVVEGLMKLAQNYILRFKKSSKHLVTMEYIRYIISLHILQGLQFIIIADIIYTFLHRSLEELAVLGVIVAIRILLGYFVGREMKGMERPKSDI